MPDREVTFSQCNDFIPTIYNLKIHGCNGWDHNLTHVEAREAMMQIANHLGYTCTHRSAKKPEPTPQARQDIAATATLHGIGYRWSDTNQWWQPAKEEHSDTVAALRTRITVLTQQAEAQDQALHRNQTGSQKMVTALSATREALGLSQNLGVGGRVEDGVLEAVQELCQANDMHERVMHCYFNACRTLGLPASTESCKEVMPAIEALKQSQEDGITAARALKEIAESTGADDVGDILPAIEALKARASNGYGINELAKIREALGVEVPKVGHYPAHGIIHAIEALKTRLDTSAVNMHEIADALRLPQGSARISLVLPSVQALRAALDQGFAALKDHGYTPDRAESIGTLIRDAFGAEAAKLRQEEKATQGAWSRGRIAGVQQERMRCIGIVQAYQRLMEERAKSTASSLTYTSAYAMSIASGEIEARIAKADPA